MCEDEHEIDFAPLTVLGPASRCPAFHRQGLPAESSAQSGSAVEICASETPPDPAPGLAAGSALDVPPLLPAAEVVEPFGDGSVDDGVEDDEEPVFPCDAGSFGGPPHATRRAGRTARARAFMVARVREKGGL